jgi:hypothetical protein
VAKRYLSTVREDELLSREDFKRLVFHRAGGRCVFCTRPAVDPHHILERKLYPDGGFYLGNGAAVCEEHHWECKTTKRSVEEVRGAAGISTPVLPPGFEHGVLYDKWGNRIWLSGIRTWGRLRNDDGAKRALALGGVLGRMMLPPEEGQLPDDELNNLR